MSDQVEWTADYVSDRFTIDPVTAGQIADAHNVELAEATDAAVQEMLLVKQQLAAEREKVTLATQMVQIESKRANEAEQKVQTLVDALKDIRVGAPDIVKQQIKDELAKVAK